MPTDKALVTPASEVAVFARLYAGVERAPGLTGPEPLFEQSAHAWISSAVTCSCWVQPVTIRRQVAQMKTRHIAGLTTDPAHSGIEHPVHIG